MVDRYRGLSQSQKNYLKLVPVGVQAVISSLLIHYMYKADVIPNKYAGFVILISALALAFTLAMGLISKKIATIMSLLSCVVVSVFSVIGICSFLTIIQVFSSVSNITYETSSMVVVVLADDDAEDILDTADYIFSTQTYTDTDNNDLMVADIESNLEQSIEVVEYSNMILQANALLNGEVDAMIINAGFIPLLEENTEGFLDSYKTIHNYGIEIEVVVTPTATPTPEIEEEELEDELVELLSITQEPFNIYISGIDTSGSISNTSRSDVNIIMSVNPTTKEILIITTPRDYYVTFPGVTGGSYDKLTHAGIYGIDVSIATLENLYDIEIDYYVKVNFTSVTTIVNALGGVEVYSEYSFQSTFDSDLYFTEGMNSMTGQQALYFSRERYAFSDGDNQRGKNQQQVIIGILNKVMSPSILSGATEIIESVSNNVVTNLTDEELSALIKMQLEDGATWSIETVSATGYDSNNSCYSLGGTNAYVMVPNQSSIEAIKEGIAEIFS